MKRFLSFMLAGVMMVALAACGSAAPEEEETEGGTQAEVTDNAEHSSELADVSEQTEGGSNMLVAYFSLAGEQYSVGVIEEGNTSIVARMIAEETGADIFEIEAAEPYPTTYDGLLDVSRREMAEGARPEIAGTVENGLHFIIQTGGVTCP